jgi:hypothetical protein
MSKYLKNKGWFVVRDGKVIRSSSKFIKRVDGWKNVGIMAKKGTFRVTYKPDFYNEFDFDSPEDFLNKVLPCFEKEVLEHIYETDSKSTSRQ